MPPPGDSFGSSRQPPSTRVECSLVKLRFDVHHLADDAVGDHALEFAHRREAALVVAEREHHAGLSAAASTALRRPRLASAPAASRSTPACRARRPRKSAARAANAASPETPPARADRRSPRRSRSTVRSPWPWRNPRTSSGSLLTPRMKRRRLLLPCADSTMFLPQRPRPITAALIMMKVFCQAGGRKYGVV